MAFAEVIPLLVSILSTVIIKVGCNRFQAPPNVSDEFVRTQRTGAGAEASGDELWVILYAPVTDIVSRKKGKSHRHGESHRDGARCVRRYRCRNQTVSHASATTKRRG